MPKIEGFTGVIRAMARLEKKFGRDMKPSVTVGFTQNYGLYVHEDMDARHEVGQAKFLEQPARKLEKTLGDLTAKAVANGATIEEGLIIAGLRLQREAQELTPVDTGALKASAFTCKTRDVDRIAEVAFKKSEKIRKSSLSKRAKKK